MFQYYDCETDSKLQRLPEQVATEDEAQHKDEEANAKNDDIDVQGKGVCDI